MAIFLKTWCNPNWLISRALEKFGIKTYLERTEFAAHVGIGGMFALSSALWDAWWMAALWTSWTFVDEFMVDGWKGRDTLIDLFSKLICPVFYFGWFIFKYHGN